jgi:hypothetical protein
MQNLKTMPRTLKPYFFIKVFTQKHIEKKNLFTQYLQPAFIIQKLFISSIEKYILDFKKTFLQII